MALQPRLTLVAIGVAIAAIGRGMTGVESPFWGNVLYAVAIVLFIAAIFGSRIERWWARRRLRGIRMRQWPFEDRPTEARITPEVPVEGLLITCEPDSAVIGRPKAHAEQKNAAGQAQRLEVMAKGRGNRVLVWVSNVDPESKELVSTEVFVSLSVGVRVVRVEPVTSRIVQEFTTDKQ